MSEFHDPELENLLGRSGGPFPDVNVAYQSVQGRVRRARRRRAVVMSSAACSLLVAAGALAVGRSGGSSSVQPGDRGSDLTDPADTRLQPGDTIDAATSTAPSTTPATTIGPSTSTSAAPTTTSTIMATTTLTVAPPSSAPAGNGGNGGNGNGNGNGNGGSGKGGGGTTATVQTSPPVVPTTTPAPSTIAPGTTPPTIAAPTTTAAAVTQTFGGIGGSITVRMEGGTLTLVSYQPADGFTAEVRHQSGSHVEVRFESAMHRTTARVDRDGGAMVDRFDESEL
ncbi:MAG: hypothetical protein WCC60_00925 [Ilumatobacteraceae bacterium]